MRKMDKWTAWFLISFAALFLIVGGIILSDMLAVRNVERPDWGWWDEEWNITEVWNVYEEWGEWGDLPTNPAPPETVLEVEGTIDRLYARGDWIYYAIVQRPADDNPLTVLVGQVKPDGTQGETISVPFDGLGAHIVDLHMSEAGHIRLLIWIRGEAENQLLLAELDETGDVQTQTEFEFPVVGAMSWGRAVFAPNGEVIVQAHVLDAAIYTFTSDGRLGNKLEVGFGDYLALTRDGRVIVVSGAARFSWGGGSATFRELNPETGLLTGSASNLMISVSNARSAPAWSEFDFYVSGSWGRDHRGGAVLFGYNLESGQLTPIFSLVEAMPLLNLVGTSLVCDDIVFLEDGRIVMLGSVWERSRRTGRTELLIYELISEPPEIP
ncbi:MAG: hypothetical protein FWE08_02695 [Oscillospiraceae bacterium]|nr:hypothetical protein [Oscillospiraceae bacterium]